MEKPKAELASCSKIVATYDINNPEPLNTFNPHKPGASQVIWNHNSNQTFSLQSF